MQKSPTDRIGYLEGNCHVERHIDDNIMVDRVATSPVDLSPTQFYMRLIPCSVSRHGDKPDTLGGRVVISKNFNAIHVPPLGKTVVVEVKMPQFCTIM